MVRHSEVTGGQGTANVVVVDTQGLARMFDHDGELVARASIRYSFGGRRLWSGPVDGRQLTVAGDWDRGVAAYADGLTTVAWDRPEIARPQRIRSTGTSIAVSTEDGGVWLLDSDGGTQARAPELDTFLCDATGIGLAVVERRLVLVSTDDLRVIGPAHTADFLPVCATQLHDGFAVGTFGGRVVAVDTAGNERFVHQLARREIARAILRPPGSAGLVVIVRDTSTSRMRIAELDANGDELHSVDIPFVIDATPYGDGSRFAVVHPDRSKVHILDPRDGSSRPLDTDA